MLRENTQGVEYMQTTPAHHTFGPRVSASTASCFAECWLLLAMAMEDKVSQQLGAMMPSACPPRPGAAQRMETAVEEGVPPEDLTIPRSRSGSS